jgi:hypothetical protein
MQFIMIAKAEALLACIALCVDEPQAGSTIAERVAAWRRRSSWERGKAEVPRRASSGSAPIPILFEARSALCEHHLGLAHGYFRHIGCIGPRAKIVPKSGPLRSAMEELRDGGNHNAKDDYKAVNKHLSIRKVLIHRFLLCIGTRQQARERRLFKEDGANERETAVQICSGL